MRKKEVLPVQKFSNFGGCDLQAPQKLKQKSRNHTELFCKHLNLPIIVKSKKKYDEITVKKKN